MLPRATRATRLGRPVAENEETGKTIEIRRAIESLDLYRSASLATEFLKRHRMDEGGCPQKQIRSGIKAKVCKKTHLVFVRCDPNAG
jgi:hypothetical protein